MHITGYIFRARSSQRVKAHIEFDQSAGVARLFADDVSYEFSTQAVRLSDAVGRVPRHAVLPDGTMFYADDAQQLLEVLNAHPSNQSNHWSHFVHQLEQHKLWIIGAFVIAVATVGLLYQFALPVAVRVIANALPATVYQKMGGQTLQILEKMDVKPSQVSAQKQAELTARFDTFAQVHQSEFTKCQPKLLFRHWEGVPNAITLADCQIIITDDLVKLLGNDEEIYAVLLHELGHAHHKDVVNLAVRSTLISAGVGMMVGDASTVADTMAGVATLAITMNYSRKMEFDADEYAAKKLMAQGLNVESFIKAFEKLEAQDQNPKPTESKTAHQDSQIETWFASHPDTQARIARLRQISSQKP